jgi:integrase
MKRKTQRPRGQGTLYKRGNRGPYIGRWYDHEGRRRERSTRTTDRAAAERILARHIADTALRRDGVIDTRADVYAAAERRPLAEHLDDWANALTAKGVTTKQIAGLKSRVTAMAGATKANRLSDITASDFQAALGRLREGDKPRSIQTVQHYLRAMKQFTRWLHADGRLRDDPLAHLAGFNPATDRRRERRPLDTGELHWLITTTESAPMWRKLGGADRAMLYRVAVGTGFRASELRSLTPASFRLDDDAPGVLLKAGSSKHRRDDLQPIRTDLAELLRKWLAGRDAQEPLWPGRWNEKAAAMLRCDLRRARARWIRDTFCPAERRKRRDSDSLAILDANGHVVDFHALRATYITALVKGGASVKVAQQLARHSDPKLTMNVYTSLGIHDLGGALDALPNVGGSPTHTEPMRAVGTYDHSPIVDSDPRLKPRQLARETRRDGAIARGEQATLKGSAGKTNHTFSAGNCDDMRISAGESSIAPGRIRTCDLRFRKPLLYPTELRARIGVLRSTALRIMAGIFNRGSPRRSRSQLRRAGGCGKRLPRNQMLRDSRIILRATG